ncbi:MAG: V-type ATP synthase subunit D [Candidatus Omnitrophica bacterium]|nr:V-type ATP synthase subunit D [Candidatus Omnitrophota bacterium]
MAKIKLTKGELKRQRDALRQYERYLPTLQLKKQQLQLEILFQITILTERKHLESKKRDAIRPWIAVLADPGTDISQWIKPKDVATQLKNIAGVDIPVFVKAQFVSAEYDLFSTPLWVDAAIEALRVLVSLEKEVATIEEGVHILRHELRITTQRVNLFEKVKIPQAREAIRLIRIYIGDQMANAVGRSKIAKRKIEEMVLEEVAA